MTSTRKTLMIAGGLLVAAAATGYVMLLRADHRAIAEAGLADSSAPGAAPAPAIATPPAGDGHTARRDRAARREGRQRRARDPFRFLRTRGDRAGARRCRDAARACARSAPAGCDAIREGRDRRRAGCARARTGACRAAAAARATPARRHRAPCGREAGNDEGGNESGNARNGRARPRIGEARSIAAAAGDAGRRDDRHGAHERRAPRCFVGRESGRRGDDRATGPRIDEPERAAARQRTREIKKRPAR